MNSTKSGNSTISESIHAAKGSDHSSYWAIRTSDPALGRRIAVLEAPRRDFVGHFLCIKYYNPFSRDSNFVQPVFLIILSF
jgi:hypothetical protein